jgi:hypothetical protein
LKIGDDFNTTRNNKTLTFWLRILIYWSKRASRLNPIRYLKEITMRYKTIVLELLQQHPEIHNALRSSRMLLSTMELYARQLKTRHEAWRERLSQAQPDSDQTQVASEALEIAVQELENFLGSPEHTEPFSVEGAIAFIHGRTPQRKQ